MRVLITGGTGQIGRTLSASLAADNHEVIVLSGSAERTSGLPDGVQAECWDARTADGWVHLAEGADAIVNLAGGFAEIKYQRDEPAQESRGLNC